LGWQRGGADHYYSGIAASHGCPKRGESRRGSPNQTGKTMKRFLLIIGVIASLILITYFLCNDRKPQRRDIWFYGVQK
jgi:hypothetical protein